MRAGLTMSSNSATSTLACARVALYQTDAIPASGGCLLGKYTHLLPIKEYTNSNNKDLSEQLVKS